MIKLSVSYMHKQDDFSRNMSRSLCGVWWQQMPIVCLLLISSEAEHQVCIVHYFESSPILENKRICHAYFITSVDFFPLHCVLHERVSITHCIAEPTWYAHSWLLLRFSLPSLHSNKETAKDQINKCVEAQHQALPFKNISLLWTTWEGAQVSVIWSYGVKVEAY